MASAAGRHSPPFERPDMSDLRIVLMGKNGSENRRVGNTILGTEVFDSEASSYSQHLSERISGKVEKTYISVVNTHLLQTQHQIIEGVRECVSLSAPGPHVFVLVLQNKDFTEEDRHRVKYVLNLFSYQAMKHTIVLTTDDEPRRSIFTSRNNSILDLIKECGGGHLKFDTRNPRWRSELFKKTEETLKKERKEFLLCDVYKDGGEGSSTDGDLTRSGASVREDKEKKDSDLKESTKQRDGALDDDPRTLTVKMSCGHAVSQETLTGYCRSLLDQGQYKFYCPALKHRTERCNEEWPYLEVSRLLSDSEKAHFEKNMALLAAAEYCEFKSCPSCGSYVEREDRSSLCVRCTICTSVKKSTFKFCWWCLREWQGAAPHCGYEDCVDPDIDKLAKCRNVTLPNVNNVECPAVRACPSCGLLLEHDSFGCKNVTCKRCQVEFCFLCLKLKSVCSPIHGPYTVCSVAPRQTEIPVWKR